MLEVAEVGEDSLRAMFWQSQGTNGDRPFQQTPPPLPLRVYSLAPATAASSPRQVQAESSPEGLHLTWQQPADDGGASVTAYRIETSRAGGVTWRHAAHIDSTRPTPNPSASRSSQELTIRVLALNEIGPGNGAAA